MSRPHTTKPLPKMSLRAAGVEDIPALLGLEERCFTTDRLTRRAFHRMLTKAKATTLVAEETATGTGGGRVLGYAMVLFHTGTSLSRLYSLAVEPEAQGRGIAQRLLAAVEADAAARDCVYMRAEVRTDNTAAITLYEKLGYRRFDVYEDYYEDHAEALRYEKRIRYGAPPGTGRSVPFYAQGTDFTCGPAALMMAMKALRPRLRLSPSLELQLWREATTIFMTSGHGGCGPQGLALAAWERDFEVEVHLSSTEPPFLDGVRSEAKKRVIRLVHEDFTARLAKTHVAVHQTPMGLAAITEQMAAGRVPLVLTSAYRISRKKAPHWIVLTGIDDRFVYAHDPDVDEDLNKTETDCMHVPIPRADFERMARYGKAQLQAVLIVNSRKDR